MKLTFATGGPAEQLGDARTDLLVLAVPAAIKAWAWPAFDGHLAGDIEAELRRQAEAAFEFHLLRRPQLESRFRLPNDRTISSLSPLELLGKYWDVVKTRPEDAEELQHLAEDLIRQASEENDV